MYIDSFGGISSMSTEHFEQINGYSNLFWGWGFEDDHFEYRWVLTVWYVLMVCTIEVIRNHYYIIWMNKSHACHAGNLDNLFI